MNKVVCLRAKCITIDFQNRFQKFNKLKMNKEYIFQELEKLLKETINVNVVQILMKFGFDSKLAVCNLHRESIKEIEQYANEDRTDLEFHII